MNYRYWKTRCQAEQTESGVRARQLFYEGTMAYKMGDFPKAAESFRKGLDLWKVALNDFPAFRDDELSKKETGLIVKRYLLVLKQLGARRYPRTFRSRRRPPWPRTTRRSTHSTQSR